MKRNDRIDAVFSALGDPTRRRVVRLLSRGPSTATELANDLPISRQAIAKHLSALDEAGLVSAERSGREVRYRLTPGPMADAASWLGDVGARWDRRLDALRRHLGG
jgi:DNA-binding transcriptional ArsR family regulator